MEDNDEKVNAKLNNDEHLVQNNSTVTVDGISIALGFNEKDILANKKSAGITVNYYSSIYFLVVEN